MAQVTALPVGVTTVNVSFIGTLESGGGSGVSNYNELDNIPVVNQDLSASGFTPVANTYYRHTGATTDTFTQGVIYLYDTAYHKLGESGGGGTTLNRYTFTVSRKPTVSDVTQILKVLNNAKRVLNVEITSQNGKRGYMTEKLTNHQYLGYSLNLYSNVFDSTNVTLRDDLGTNGMNAYATTFSNSTFKTTNISFTVVEITYLNDTEIT